MSNSEMMLVRQDPSRDQKPMIERAKEKAKRLAKEEKLAARRKSAAAKAAAKMTTSRGNVRKRALKRRSSGSKAPAERPIEDMPAEEFKAHERRDYVEDVRQVCLDLADIDPDVNTALIQRSAKFILHSAVFGDGVGIMIKGKMRTVRSYVGMVKYIREDVFRNAHIDLPPSQEPPAIEDAEEDVATRKCR